MQTIPKIIHYCWFGKKPLPQYALRCIDSWKRFLPDYEIIEWNETNFNVDIIPYTTEAYKQGKYAFVSDYARFWIIYKYGGIYLDIDVEIIKPLDDIISEGCYMGFELDPDGKNSPDKYAPRYSFAINPGVGFAMSSHHPFVHEMLLYYSHLEFDAARFTPWYKTIVAHTTECLYKKGLENRKGIQEICFDNYPSIKIYPSAYFSPINIISKRLHITPLTHSIHHYTGNWDGERIKESSLPSLLYKKIISLLPEQIFFTINKIKRMFYKR